MTVSITTLCYYAKFHDAEAFHTECHYARYAEGRYAEYYYAECHYAECRGTVLYSQYLKGENLKVVWTEFLTLGWTVLVSTKVVLVRLTIYLFVNKARGAGAPNFLFILCDVTSI